MFFLYDGHGAKLTTVQIHTWSVRCLGGPGGLRFTTTLQLLIGAAFGVVITGYAYLLELLIDLIWRMGGNGLRSAGLNPYMLNWFVPLVYGGGLGGVLLWLAKRYNLECGYMVQVIRGVHLPGSMPFKVRGVCFVPHPF